MHSIIHFIYNYIGKSNVHPNVYSNGNEHFSDIFFDKFKNLLDDYIVNYQIKYFFYFLFISFFYLELSESMFQLLHNYNSYHVSIFGSFVIDLCSFLSHINFIDFIYNFFAFNLDAIGYLFSLLSNYSNTYCILLMPVIALVYYRINNLLGHIITLNKLVYIYSIYSFIFFLLYYFNIISLSFYIFFSLLLMLLYTFYIINFNIDKLDTLIISSICLMVLAPMPILFLLFVISIYFFVSSDHKFYNLSLSSITYADLTHFLDYILLLVFTIFIASLGYTSMGINLLVLALLPFFLYIVYMDQEHQASTE